MQIRRSLGHRQLVPLFVRGSGSVVSTGVRTVLYVNVTLSPFSREHFVLSLTLIKLSSAIVAQNFEEMGNDNQRARVDLTVSRFCLKRSVRSITEFSLHLDWYTRESWCGLVLSLSRRLFLMNCFLFARACSASCEKSHF